MSGTHIVGGEQGEKRRSLGGGFDSGAAIHLLAVDQAKHADHLKFCVTCSLDGLDGRGSSGADVIDNHHARTGLVESFNTAASAVSLF